MSVFICTFAPDLSFISKIIFIMKNCVNIVVYQNQHCKDAKKRCFERLVWMDNDVMFPFRLVVDALRVLFGSQCIVCVEDSNVE